MNNKKIIYSLSFFIPIAIIFICWFILKVPPFGDNVFLFGDDEIEYMNFFSYYKTFFTSNNTIFYSLARCGGAPMFNMLAFYNFVSPLNFLFFFCPEEYMNIGFQFLIALKLGFCGLSFAYFLNKEFGSDKITSVFFAVAYALSADSVITSMANFIFVDCLILLPLVLLGVSWIVRNNDFRLFLVTMTLALLSNGYSGYVSLLFAGCWFIYKYFLENGNDYKKFFEKAKIFVSSSLLVCGLSAWLLLPVFLGLSNEKYSFFDMDSLFEIRCNFFGLLSKFFSNNIVPYRFDEDLSPFVFVGIFTFVLFLLYFFNNSITKKERCLSAIFLGFLIGGFTLNFLFVVWTMGVEDPNGTIFRFTFIFKFFVIFLAYKSFLQIKNIDIKNLFHCVTLFVVITAAVLISKFYYAPIRYLLVDSVLALIFFDFIFRYVKGKHKNFYAASFIIIALFLCNMAENTLYIYSSQNKSSISSKASSFKKYVLKSRKILSFLKKTDKNFYRVESETWFSNPSTFFNNAPLMMNFNGISHYSSFIPEKSMDAYEKMGIFKLFDEGGVAYRKQQIIFPSCFMGVKYVISSSKKEKYPFKLVKYQHNKSNGKELFLFKNTLALPIAFLIDYSPKLLTDFASKSNCDFQNDILKALSGKDFGDVYTSDPLTFAKERFSYKVKSNDNLYIYATNNHKVEFVFEHFKINGKDFFDNYMPMATSQYNYFGKFQKDSVLLFDYKTHIKNNSKDDIKFSVIYENIPKLQKYYKEIADAPCKVEKISSSHLKIYMDVEKQHRFLFLTIPYDKGWHIKVDGDYRKPIKVFESFMAIPVNPEDKVLEMNYVPVGFVGGLIVSTCSFILLLICMIAYKKPDCKE